MSVKQRSVLLSQVAHALVLFENFPQRPGQTKSKNWVQKGCHVKQRSKCLLALHLGPATPCADATITAGA